MDASFRLDNRKRKQNQKEKAKSDVGSGVRLALAVVFHADTNYRHRIEDGAAILNVAAGDRKSVV